MVTAMYAKLQKMTAALLMIILFVLPCASAYASAVDSVQVRSAPLSSDTITKNGMVRVYLSSLGNPSSLDLTVQGNYSISTNGQFVAGGTKLRVGFNASTGELTLSWNGQTFHMGRQFSLRRHSASGTNGILIAQARESRNPYPGDLSFEAVSNGSGYTLYTVAHIYIEDYLYGVLPYEMGNSSGMAALKAQAVAARTYTVRMMERRSSGRYDVVDTTSDQVYRGTPSGNANCVAAVDATRGIVLMYGADYITTYYSASNGGQTEISRSGSSYAYMKVKDDPFDYANPSSTVRKKTIYADLTSPANPAGLTSMLKSKAITRLQRSGYPANEANTALKTLKAVTPHTPMYASPSRLYTLMDFTFTVTTQNTSGQPVQATVTETCHIFTELESMLGMGIQSLQNELWSVEKKADSFVLQARRYGHGMGMSQRGAMYMAKLGYSYDQILGFYYDGCSRVRHSFTSSILSGSSGDQQITVDTPAELEPAAPSGCIGTVTLAGNGQTLALRAAASADTSVIGTAGNGALMSVLSRDGNWCLVRFGELVGYVPASALVIQGMPEGTEEPVTSIQGFATVKASDFVNLRSAASMSGRVLGTAPAGAVLTVIRSENSWAWVQYEALAAYVNTNYITAVTFHYPAEDLSSGSRRAMVITEEGTGTVNLRKSASMDAQLVDRLPAGTIVTVISNDGSWSRIEAGSKEGYMLSSYLVYEAEPENENEDEADEEAEIAAPEQEDGSDKTPEVKPFEPSEETVPEYAVVNTESGSLNLRAQADSGSMVLTTVPRGVQVQVLARGNEWSAVRYGTFDGYVMSRYLLFASVNPEEEKEPAPTGITAVVVTPGGSLNLRALPHTGARILYRIPASAVVDVLERGSSWCRVEYLGITGYVMTSFLSFKDTTPPADSSDGSVLPEKPETEETPAASKEYLYVHTKSGSLNLRSDPDGNSLIVASVPQYAKVVVIEKGSEWTRIVYDGRSGYVMSAYLSPEKPIEKENAEAPQQPSESEKQERAYITLGGIVLDVTLEAPDAVMNAAVLETVWLYDMCSENGSKLTQLPSGEEVEILLLGDIWCRVAWQNMQGYCLKQKLNVR